MSKIAIRVWNPELRVFTYPDRFPENFWKREDWDMDTAYEDKNGRRIFKNDIIRAGNGDVCLVKSDKWHNTIMYNPHPINQKVPYTYRYFNWEKEFFASNVEVIGNIWENSDLLKT